MRERKVHLVVALRCTLPKYFPATSTYVLCDRPNAERVTKDRALVTCNLCKHFIRYSDKHVIERGNAPPAILAAVERVGAYRAKALAGKLPRYDEEVSYRQTYRY